MTIRVNLDEVEAWKGSGILPPGKHLCRINRADEGTSSGGHPQIELELEAADGEYAGGTIRDWLVITPASLGKVRMVLESAGIEIPSGEFEIPTDKLPGSIVTILVREEPGQEPGTKRNRVAAYDVPAESDVPADTEGLPVGAGASSKDDEDIPF